MSYVANKEGNCFYIYNVWEYKVGNDANNANFVHL